MQRRAIFEQEYIQLRQTHPSLPAQLRDFQVSCIPAHLRPEKKTLVRCLILGWRSGFCRLWHWGRPYPVPTGYGKTMGPLITSLLLPPGKAINKIWIFEAPLYNLIIPRPPSNKSWMNQPRFPSFTSGSTTLGGTLDFYCWSFRGIAKPENILWKFSKPSISQVTYQNKGRCMHLSE